MAKKTTRQTSDTEEPRAVSSGSKVMAVPKVKKMAPEEKAPQAPPPPCVYVVTLLEGATYKIRGMTFHAHRPVMVTDPTILGKVATCSQFKVSAVGGGNNS